MGLLFAAAGQSAATAEPSPLRYTAQARAAGLSAHQAQALQRKVDGYLDKLRGRGTQVSPNQIDMNGAMLNVTVPGEELPRQLVPAAEASQQATVCKNWADTNSPVPYGWFCAYEREWGNGDSIGMYACDNYFIPWYNNGSWQNNQTTGTVPRVHYAAGGYADMPAAPSIQGYTMNWTVVHSITNCQ
ncbi:hypothetical protein [Streptomyces sp. NPDC127119]|uniref:hypothetical protein n=1 Tax=Streptomyces sp. NPDC127119 TaxID=3345370 RepID=UPI00363E1CA3